MDNWSFEENKKFENAIGELGVECPNLFQEIAQRVPGKSIEEIQKHYNELVRDVALIESGCADNKMATQIPKIKVPPGIKRRKPSPWTDEEHEAFLIGMEKYGKGDWKAISRHCVPSKTPSQIASHGQKYFQKLKRNAQKREAEALLNQAMSDLAQSQANSSTNNNASFNDDNGGNISTTINNKP